MGNGNFVDTAEAAMQKELEKLKDKGATEAELAEARTSLGPAGEVWCIDAATHEVRWRYATARVVLGSIAAGNEGIYFGSRDGRVYCLSHAGQELATWNAHAAIVASPALTDTTVYIVTDRGRLFGLERQTLRPQWETTIGTGTLFLSSPTVARGHVYIGSPENGLVCIGGPGTLGTTAPSVLPKRGALLWRYPEDDAEPAAITASAACSGDILCAPFSTGRHKGVICFEATSTERGVPPVRWSFETKNGVHWSPATDGEVVFFVDGKTGDAGRHLHRVDARTGAERWKTEVGTEASGRIHRHQDVLFLEAPAGGLTCFDRNGKILWQRSLGAIAHPPASRGSIVTVAAQEPAALLALDRLTGKTLWQHDLAAPLTAGPVLRGTMLYLGSPAGLEARELVDGTLIWRSKTGAVNGALALTRSWIAYVNGTAQLVAVDTTSGEPIGKPQDADPSVPPLAARDSVLYLSAKGLMAYRPTTTERPRRWMAVSWLGAVTAPPIIAKGRVFFATDKKGLICAGVWKEN
jgi:outer membrane protein assembly factor BamB